MFKFSRNFLFLFFLTISSAFAVGDTFDQARFEQLLKEGKPILVGIHADWCSVCRSQDVALQDLLKSAPYSNIKVLRVDFDKQKNIVRTFHVRWQSTLIVFRNGKEVDRSTADTDENSIANLLREVL